MHGALAVWGLLRSFPCRRVGGVLVEFRLQPRRHFPLDLVVWRLGNRPGNHVGVDGGDVDLKIVRRERRFNVRVELRAGCIGQVCWAVLPRMLERERLLERRGPRVTSSQRGRWHPEQLARGGHD
jgi:hypothetical protein